MHCTSGDVCALSVLTYIVHLVVHPGRIHPQTAGFSCVISCCGRSFLYKTSMNHCTLTAQHIHCWSNGFFLTSYILAFLFSFFFLVLFKAVMASCSVVLKNVSYLFSTPFSTVQSCQCCQTLFKCTILFKNQV